MPRLTDLTAATTPLDGTEVLYVVQGGNSRRTTTQEVAALVSGRNLIINGSGRINQRGYVSGAATSGANQFTLDRWFVVTSGQNLTFTGNDSARVMTAPAGGVSQVIEGANIVGGTYVLNWTGTATATVGGVARTKGETFTLTANTNVTVTFASGTFSEVQIERGTVATPFELRSKASEEILCYRYYFDAAKGTTTRHYGQYLYAGGAATLVNAAQVGLPVTMASIPAIAIRDTLFSGVATGISSNINNQNNQTFNVTTSGAGGGGAEFNFSVSAELTS